MFSRKIAISAVSIFAAFALVAGGTFAYFSDSATSTNNTFSSGNADLQISLDSDGVPTAYLETVPGFSETNIFPGFNETYTLWLRNASTAAIGLDNVAKFVNVGGAETMQDELSVSITCTRQGDSNVTAAGPFTVNQWEAGQGAIGSLLVGDGLPNGAGTDEAKCLMNVTLPTSSELAGQSANFDVLVDATQTP